MIGAQAVHATETTATSPGERLQLDAPGPAEERCEIRRPQLDVAAERVLQLRRRAPQPPAACRDRRRQDRRRVIEDDDVGLRR